MEFFKNSFTGHVFLSPWRHPQQNIPQPDTFKIFRFSAAKVLRDLAVFGPGPQNRPKCQKMAQNGPKSGPNVLNRCTKLRFLGVPERLEMVLSLLWPPMHHFGGPGAPAGANLRPFGLRRVKWTAYADPPRMVLGVPTRVQNTSRRSGTPKNLTKVVLAAR